MLPKILVTIATYNEIANLPALIEELFRHAPQVDLLVIDDNSPDGTGEWAANQARSNPRIQVLHRPEKMGLGTAKIAGMQHALAHEYEYVLNLDGDFSHHPRYIPALLEGMQQHDVMIGSRYVPHGSTPDWPLSRRLMSRAVNFYARWLLGLKPRDCSGGFRCYRVSYLARLDFASIRSRGYSFQEEVLWRLKRLGARMGETPIEFTDRQHGHSKINTREAVAAVWIIFRLGLTNCLGF